MIKNFEFKARVEDLDVYEKKLQTLNPRFVGTDFQTDTYFDVPVGRLKMREGNIENSLIFYNRENLAESKESNIILYKPGDEALKKILTLQFPLKVVVRKERRIYFIENVKFHFDRVEKLGTFVEVEVIDQTGKQDSALLKEKCESFRHFFNLEISRLEERSYSDLLLEQIAS